MKKQSILGSKAEDFLGCELYSIMVTHIIIRLSTPIECTPPRMSPNVNYQLWLMICQLCSLIVIKVPVLCRMLVVGEVSLE